VRALSPLSDSRQETEKVESMERMYTIKEICLALGVKRRSVHYWIAKGELKAFHLGGKRITRVWEKDLRGFVKRTGR
jgi:excisionase family DNA binding protein